MSYNNRLLNKINVSKKAVASTSQESENNANITDMMLNPGYLRQSSTLINEALQKGFDVLQLANGDIVTTGTKTVVYQYTWDEEKSKLVKKKPESAKKRRSANSVLEEESEEV